MAPSGEISSSVTHNTGVPQGSLNGPGFFGLFINVYTDDLTVYYAGSFSELNVIIVRVNEDLEHLAHWAATNGLSINAQKSQAIWLGTRNFIRRFRDLSLPEPILDGQPIAYCDTVKILGFTLDSILTWSRHCSNIARKYYGALARLRKCHNFIPRETKLLLVKAHIFPYFDYCAGLLLSLSNDLCTMLGRCIKATLRFVTGISKFDHITPPYEKLQILPFMLRREYICLCLLASILAPKNNVRSLLTFRLPGF